jgi:hypothetical protein
MKESVMSIRVIEPSDGYYLTKRNRNENEDLILSKKVVLSAKDSPENWVEISEEEGDALRRKELKEQGLLSEDEEFVA